MRIDILPFASAAELAGIASQAFGADRTPGFCALYHSERLDVGPLAATAAAAGAAVIGGTSCRGVMSDRGISQGMLVVLDDPDGSYGTALRPLGDDPRRAAAAATEAAILAAGRAGEAPALVWIYGTPGAEEALLAGIESVVGPETPILGGSAADDAVAGTWHVRAGTDTSAAGVAVAVLYPSGEVIFAYQNGYAPAPASGRATRVEGRRVLEIDGRPAAQVYAEWTAGAIAAEPRNILSDSAFWPLGREMHQLAGVPYYLLAHPSEIDAEGALHLFADISEGEVLTQMTGSVDGLTSRAGRVASLALRTGGRRPDDVAGALVVYCGGCMLSVRDRIDEVVAGVRGALPGIPFGGVFTFGEQGPIVAKGNRHGNLMISCIAFCKS